MQSTVGSRAFQNARLQKKFNKQAEALCSAAFAAYRAGKVADAQSLCRQILQNLPSHFSALHLLGVSELDRGRYEEARDILERAVAADPKSADVYSDLGTVYFELKRYEDARATQERAIALNPSSPIALTNLGNTLLHLGLAAQAIELHDRAIRLKPDYADAYCNRGMAEMALGRREEAAQSFDRALLFQPQHLEALGGKGMLSTELRHYEAAQAVFAKALAIRANSPKILAHRGRMRLQQLQLAEAAADFDTALALMPTLELALRGKALVSLIVGNTALALAACKKLLEQNPKSEIAIALMGACLAAQGETASAIEHYDRALAINPQFEDAITRKIFALDFLPEADYAVQQEARKQWWKAIGSRFKQRELAPRPLDPERRIVVGYVSSDFRRHSAAFAFIPVLRQHDHANFQINCYSCSPLQDEMTDEFRSLSDVWVDAARHSDDELANRIQADGVDILIDLSGHSAGNRLGTFARKPAPIQVTAWGHAAGTGLPTIDYFFADPVTIPESARPAFVERIYDLPAVITMAPIMDLPLAPLPMLHRGYVTFGVFNRIYKISDEVLSLWSALMRKLAGSRIVIKHGLLDDPLLRDGLVARFVAHGIAEDRITCLGSTSRGDHLLAFADVDISLDTFPQNGGISTWESLYMGVPVVAKLGNGASSRMTGAILNGIGLDDWFADDEEGYLAIAEKYAAMPQHLEKLRGELRDIITRSAAGNPEIYTRKVEEGYRRFWGEYCASAARSNDAA